MCLPCVNPVLICQKYHLAKLSRALDSSFHQIGYAFTLRSLDAGKFLSISHVRQCHYCCKRAWEHSRRTTFLRAIPKHYEPVRDMFVRLTLASSKRFMIVISKQSTDIPVWVVRFVWGRIYKLGLLGFIISNPHPRSYSFLHKHFRCPSSLLVTFASLGSGSPLLR